jgi:hypothetical protein
MKLLKATKTKKGPLTVKMKNENNTVCYTGIGSDNKNPNYTKSTFKKLANTTFKKECSEFHASKKCKPCDKVKTLVNNFMKDALPDSNYKMPAKLTSKYNKLYNKCKVCKKATKKKACSFDEYVEYSGAEIGKC